MQIVELTEPAVPRTATHTLQPNIQRYVCSFAEGNGKDKKLLGGKGANLCEMTQIGVNVPPGLIITTEACMSFLNHPNRELPEGLMTLVGEKMKELETLTGKRFGDTENPLLVSVRSGAAISMPGMMDTILNLGLNEYTLQGLIQQTRNERFGYDTYRRFIQLYGNIALGIPDEKFDEAFETVKRRAAVLTDEGLETSHLIEICDRFLAVVKNLTGRPFPADVYEQLELAIKAVFNSWMGRRAIDYRREFGITPEMAEGTAVTVQSMVFGNMGSDSATGVAFTRDPGTGENTFFGEYLVNAQGEDVVAGIRTPKPVAELEKEMPALFTQLSELRSKLEHHYREVQDIEFTIEKGVLYCLQTRNGKMNAAAMVRTSVEMVEEKLITKEQALLRVKPHVLEQLLHPRLEPTATHQATPLARGLAASPGAASGMCVLDADKAEALAKEGKEIILVREETKPEDIHGFFAAKGILTSRGGKTSHAAVVARGMGKPCVAGAEGIVVDVKRRQAHIGDCTLTEGDLITIDGSTGNVYKGTIPTVEPTFSVELQTLLSWADEVAAMEVFANADTPEAAQKAVEYGAMGIGLCRTERMFNASDRLPVVVEMILANTTEERQQALNKLLPMQRQDFKEILTTMAPRPVTIRLLDPPIHEFLPTEETLRNELEQLRHLRHTTGGVTALLNSLQLLQANAEANKSTLMPFNERGADLVNQAIGKKEQMLKKVHELYEVNPMLGHRGVRLGLTYPEIFDMQIRAVLEAAAECQAAGIDVNPEIMVPQVVAASELEMVNRRVKKIRAEIEEKFGLHLRFKFGTMIEAVRACTVAEEIAHEVEFFSFGTNDLTQATFSFSREDAENKFLPFYVDRALLPHNPFEVLDRKGVGKLMKMAVDDGRQSRPGLKVGICGEHGGHPDSIEFCRQLGLSYVSCSSPRVPVARLAAAHAELKIKMKVNATGPKQNGQYHD